MVDGRREVGKKDLWTSRGVVLELNWDIGSLVVEREIRYHMLPDLHARLS